MKSWSCLPSQIQCTWRVRATFSSWDGSGPSMSAGTCCACSVTLSLQVHCSMLLPVGGVALWTKTVVTNSKIKWWTRPVLLLAGGCTWTVVEEQMRRKLYAMTTINTPSKTSLHNRGAAAGRGSSHNSWWWPPCIPNHRPVTHGRLWWCHQRTFGGDSCWCCVWTLMCTVWIGKGRALCLVESHIRRGGATGRVKNAVGERKKRGLVTGLLAYLDFRLWRRGRIQIC